MTIAPSAIPRRTVSVWPTAAQYNEAIQNLATSVSDQELQAGVPITNALGLPMPYAGGFADVYQIHCPATGNTWAIKCFTKSVAGLRERYAEISRCLEAQRLPFMIDFQYLDRGIRIGSDWHPIVKMPWIEGHNLNRFVAQSLDRPRLLDKLFQLWVRVAVRLREAGIAHADLQHGNVMLVPEDDQKSLSLKLIDYDGMFVPKLADRPSSEVGHRNYQHPQRISENIYSCEVDRFSNLAICCAIRAVRAGGRALWEQWDLGENLIFREQDFVNPGESALFRELWTLRDPDCRSLVGHLILATQGSLEEVPWIDELMTGRHVRPLSSDEIWRIRALLAGNLEGLPQPVQWPDVDASLAKEEVIPPPIQMASSTQVAPTGQVSGAVVSEQFLEEVLGATETGDKDSSDWSKARTTPSYCGECFAELPRPSWLDGMPVTIDAQGNLKSDFVSIQRLRSGNRVQSRIVLRDGPWHGPQPPRHFARSSVVVVAAILICLALGESVLLALKGLYAMAVLVGVGGTLGSGAAICFYRPRMESPLSIVWELIVPRMLRQPLSNDFFSFLVGLARLSEPSPDPLRQPAVESAAAMCLAWYQDRRLPYPYAVALYRLLLIDLIRNDSTRSRATSFISELLYRWRERQLPIEALDGITGNGALLNRLTQPQQRLLKWRLVYETARSGVSPEDLKPMAAASATLLHLLSKPESLSAESLALAFAVARLEDDQVAPLKGLSLFDVASKNDPSYFADSTVRALLWSGKDLAINEEGIYFRQIQLNRRSTATISTLVEFVRTGWKHQRADGGQDRRFKNNLPVGYNRILGYILEVDGRKFDYANDPTPIADRIQLWLDLYFGQLAPAIRTLMRPSELDWRMRFCNADQVRCQRCGTLQLYREGQIAIRLDSDPKIATTAVPR